MIKPQCWAVIPAGGSGSRFSSTQNKLLAPLGGKPVLCRTVATLLSIPEIEGIVITTSENNLETYQNLLLAEFPDQNLIFTLGGASRRASVYQGLLALPSTVKIVVIHDAARPLIQATTIQHAIQTVTQGALGSVVAIPITDTIKQVDAQGLAINQTIDRTTLWRAQTPQVFLLKPLLEAHQSVSSEIDVTDDAQVLELAGKGPVIIIPGCKTNLKITTQSDITLAEWYLKQSLKNLPISP